MKVLAKDAKAGQWYDTIAGDRHLCIQGTRMANEAGVIVFLQSDVVLIHLPNCDGWGWQPPQPEKKYRPFANAAEYMPHRGRWIYFCDNQSNQLLPYSIDNRGIWHASITIGWESLFAEAKFADDGTPLGVEAKE